MAWSEAHDSLPTRNRCLVINYNDEITGYDNKYNVHKMIAGQPKGGRAPRVLGDALLC